MKEKPTVEEVEQRELTLDELSDQGRRIKALIQAELTNTSTHCVVCLMNQQNGYHVSTLDGLMETIGFLTIFTKQLIARLKPKQDASPIIKLSGKRPLDS